MSTAHIFEKQIASFISSRKLLHKGAPVIVALSGGADSVALLAVLSRLGYDCRAAHCNFHLRGEESMRDMRHARDIAAQLDVDLYIRDFDVPEYQKKTGTSVEMACRDLRYSWFADLLDRDSAQAVAVGHHRSDRVETFLLNLMRGTGISGLTSMRPRSGNVIRPMLERSRAEIEDYLAALNLSFITDSSNASDAHRRNRLRNNIIPKLERAFPCAGDAILRTISNLEETEAIYREAISLKKERYLAENRINLADLSQESCPETILFEMLRPLSFTYTQVCDMLESARASGQRFFSTDGKVLAETDHGTIELSDAQTAAAELSDCYTVNPRHDISEPLYISVTCLPVEAFAPTPAVGASAAYFDIKALEGNAVWQLRHPRRGDRMIPFGSKKPKLLSDIFANAKLSASQKRRQWVLTRNDEIVWLPGLKNSAAYPVGPGTGQFIKMSIAQNDSEMP